MNALWRAVPCPFFSVQIRRVQRIGEYLKLYGAPANVQPRRSLKEKYYDKISACMTWILTVQFAVQIGDKFKVSVFIIRESLLRLWALLWGLNLNIWRMGIVRRMKIKVKLGLSSCFVIISDKLLLGNEAVFEWSKNERGMCYTCRISVSFDG